MNLEPILQSEVNQKEKYKYYILVYVYEIQKDGIDEFICRAAMEKQTQRTDVWTWGGVEERVGYMERVTCKLTLPYVKQIAKQGLCINLEWWSWEGDGREFREGGDIGVPMVDSC